MTTELEWVSQAKKYLGQREVNGLQSNAWIIGLWQSVSWIWSTVSRKDDSVLPWCGAFMRQVMGDCNIDPPKKWWSAASWADWGVRLLRPTVGCIAVKKRRGGAHVTMIVGKDRHGKLIGLGGNQGDSVKYSRFSERDFVAFVYPKHPDIEYVPLPIMDDAEIDRED